MTLDLQRVEAFAGHLVDTFGKGLVTYMIDVAARTGLLDTLAGGPGTSEQLAERAGLNERYVRECLAGLATGRIVEYDAATKTFTLPAEHAACLTGHTSGNMAPVAHLNVLLGRNLEGIEEAFRHGGGLGYDAYPEFTELMDRLGRATFDEQLIDGYLPLAPGVAERLTAGARVADIGCGSGHTTNLLARAFPSSTFVGYDFLPRSIEAAQKESAELGLTNVAYEVLDVATLQPGEPFDVAFAFDAIHDQAHPAQVLRRIAGALVSGGIFVMVDIHASSNLEDNLPSPLAPLIYGTSLLHCMTVSLAQGGDGLGTAWGEQLARAMLAEAGFATVDTASLPQDPFNLIYTAHKP